MTTRTFSIAAVVAADGTGTFYSPYFSGTVRAIQYIKTDYADTADFAITLDVSGQGLWTEANVTAAATKYPLTAAHSTVGVAVTYDGTRPILVPVIASRDRVKIIIAQGGTSTTGAFKVTVEE